MITQDLWSKLSQVKILRKDKVFVVEDDKQNKFIQKLYKNSKKLEQALISIKNKESSYLLKIIDIKIYGDKIHVLHEYCKQGSLENFINTIDCKQKIIKCMNDILQAVRDLKELNLMHRDIKPQNIVFDGKNYKLIDFETIKTITNTKVQSRVGTTIYMAPEVLLMKKYSEKCDIWSLGCVLYYLIYKIHLFQDFDILQSYENLYSQESTISLPKHEYDNHFSELLIKMLQPKEDNRISLKDIIIPSFQNLTQSTNSSIPFDDQSQINWQQPQHSIQLDQTQFINYITDRELDEVTRLVLYNSWIKLIQRELYLERSEQNLQMLKLIMGQYLIELTLYKQNLYSLGVINHQAIYNEFITKEEIINFLQQKNNQFESIVQALQSVE